MYQDQMSAGVIDRVPQISADEWIKRSKYPLVSMDQVLRQFLIGEFPLQAARIGV